MRMLQRSLAALACVGMLISPASQSWGADPPARSEAPTSSQTTQHLDLTYIPAEAVAAIIVHPQAVLAGPGTEMMPLEVITAAGMKEAGLDPLTIREAVVVFAPPDRGRDPSFGVVLRFSEAYSKANVAAKLKGAKEIIVDGKTFLQIPDRDAPLFYFPDDRTMILALPSLMKPMLSGKELDSPLIGLLKKVDTSAQLTAVFSIDAVRDTLKQVIAAAPPVPPQFQDFLKAPDLLSAILLRVGAGERFKASLILRGRDEASAEEVERIVNEGLTLGRQMALAEIANAPRGRSDPVEEAGMKYMTRITDKIFGMIKPVRNGQNVTISVETGSSVATIGILVALLLPAVQAARAAANRNMMMNKMRQIGLALLNYESEHRRFPAHAIFDKEGKPLLSWRVQILPFIEENELYKQFHLDEPWDSEHNKELIEKMPMAYANPNRPLDFKTSFLVPVGKGLAFEGTEGAMIRSFTDGTSNTILAVEANDDRAVIWTKPDDLEVDLNKPLDGLGEAESGGIFAAVFVDGHTIGLSDQVDLQTLKALFTRNGGEAIDPDLIR